jgi:muramoyltetrapeptide carboxypeptidase
VIVAASTIETLKFPGFDVRCAHPGYLAGGDGARLASLEEAFADRRIEAVFAARGGYGAPRIVEEFEGRCGGAVKWLVGFSDVTALHRARVAGGHMSLHGANVTGLAAAHAADRRALLAALEGEAFHPLATPRMLNPGAARGVVVGGNLALVHAEAAAGRWRAPEGAIVVLEDVGERPYRVDRLLTTLGPALATASAVVFGDFTEAAPGPDGVTVEEVLDDFAARNPALPMVAGGRFGHGARNAPIPLGAVGALADGWLLFS